MVHNRLDPLTSRNWLPIVQFEHILNGHALLSDDCQNHRIPIQEATGKKVGWQLVAGGVDHRRRGRFRQGLLFLFLQFGRQVIQHVKRMLESYCRLVAGNSVQGTDRRANNLPFHFYDTVGGYKLEENFHLRPQAHIGFQEYASTGDVDDLSLKPLVESDAFQKWDSRGFQARVLPPICIRKVSYIPFQGFKLPVMIFAVPALQKLEQHSL